MPILASTQIAFIEGVAFDPFFRGLLSVLVGVVVLIGGTYLLIATNTGTRTGFLIALAGLFGWCFLMGIIWTVYGIGWIGSTPVWELAEVNVDHNADADDGLLFSEIEEVQVLHNLDLGVTSVENIDEAQLQALENSRSMDLGVWRYLTASDGIRGEAQATAEAFLLEEGVFEGGDYLALQFGGFVKDGKPVLVENANMVDRVVHFFDETFMHPTWDRELIVIQVQATEHQPTYPGEAPPAPVIDQQGKMVSVIMERNRQGPFPSIISGLRFTPLMFTIFCGLIFAVLAWNLHTRDRRIDSIRSAVT